MINARRRPTPTGRSPRNEPKGKKGSSKEMARKYQHLYCVRAERRLRSSHFAPKTAQIRAVFHRHPRKICPTKAVLVIGFDRTSGLESSAIRTNHLLSNHPDLKN